MKRYKVINTSGSPVGLCKIKAGRIAMDNVAPNDYRVMSQLTPQVRRLADPSLRILKIIYEEVN